MTTTNNHDYEKPEAGTTDWHIPLNENFDRLDSDVVVVDVESNWSDYAPNDDQVFLADDTGTVFVGDGSQWVRLGTLPSRRFYQGTSEPSDPQAGDVWYDLSSNQAPTASFTVSKSDLTVNVDASGSEDPEGSISSYDWSFGNGTTATGVTASHTYGSDGTYTITLTITDSAGATDSTSTSVSVSDETSTSTGTVDDFADGDIAEYGGDTGNWSAQSNVVYTGSYAVAAEHSSGNSGITSTSGLDRATHGTDRSNESRRRSEKA